MKKYWWILMVIVTTQTSCTEKNATAMQWHHSAEDIRFECKQAGETLMAALNQISQLEANGFLYTVVPIETALAHYVNAVSPLTFYGSVSPQKDIREAGVECEKQTSKLRLEVFTREDLFRVVQRAEKEKPSLDPVDQRLLDDYLLSFRENGLGLKPEDKANLEALRKELITLESEFQQTLTNWDEVLHFSKTDLQGLPESILKRLKPSEQAGKDYILTLKYPDYFPAMEYVKNPTIRQQLFAKFRSRGGIENKRRFEKAIAIRYQIAKILGYENFASLKLESKMAKSPEAVKEFLQRIQLKLRAKSNRDAQELLTLKQKETGNPQASRLEEWDILYYERILKETKYNVDPQLVKTYFPLEKVMAGMFEIYQKLLGVEFKEVKEAPTWHQEVSYFEVIDPKSNKQIAGFYLDLFPRDGKYGHAAAFTLTAGYRDPSSGRYTMPLSSIVANFNPPEDGKPSLLTHDEVETLFHEFGHIMHQTLTTAKYASLSGTSVKRDFVEAPSQMLENWVWHREPLALISGHYQTGAKLPDELLQKMIAAKKLNQGIKYLKQVFYASIDMAYHTLKSDQDVDTTKLYHDVYEAVTHLPAYRQTIPEAGFGHLMGGYDAGYYGYLWSEVFAADMFTLFASQGLFNEQTGARYRQWILAPGGSRDPYELISGFLGRQPNEDAFIKQFED